RERIDMATNIQDQLKEFGIDVEVETLEWGAYLEQTAEGKHDMFVLGWSTVTGDADYGLYPLFHSENVGDPGNRSFLKDDRSEEHTSELQSRFDLVCRLLLEKKDQRPQA